MAPDRTPICTAPALDRLAAALGNPASSGDHRLWVLPCKGAPHALVLITARPLPDDDGLEIGISDPCDDTPAREVAFMVRTAERLEQIVESILRRVQRPA